MCIAKALELCIYALHCLTCSSLIKAYCIIVIRFSFAKFTMYLIFATADVPGAGRFNLDCMSQQMAMETLLAEVYGLEAIQNADGTFLDVEQWEGLDFDSEGNITEIDFECEVDYELIDDEENEPLIGPGGSMDLQWISQSVTSFSVANNELEGSVDTQNLPRGLEKFNISFNEFSGEFSLAGLPNTLQLLNIQSNRLSGSLVLADLPRGMEKMFASRNRFTGELNLDDLPPQIEEFAAKDCQLSGALSMRHMPASMKLFDIIGNAFGQDVLVANVADSSAYLLLIQKERFGKIIDENGNDMSHKFQF